MSSLSVPWSGLALVAPHVDLWPVLRALGMAPWSRGGVVRAPGAAPPDIGALRLAGLSAPQAMKVAGSPAWPARPGVRFLHAGMAEWPGLLTDVPYGPVAFAAEGDIGLFKRPGVAIVGARACTGYGRDWAARVASAVAAAGGVVVSGLASGIDSAAHAAAGGATIAVLGQGIDAPMAAWQRRAREAILAQGGLIVSEFEPTTPASTFTFPIRNRVIAGLARVVAVIEAGTRSGARITAGEALRYGRDVLALPGQAGAPASEGCLDLIEQGATLIRSAATVLGAAGLLRPIRAQGEGPGSDAAEADAPVARVWASIGRPASPDDLVAATGLGRTAVLEALGLLELTGRAIRLPGGRYQARAP